MRLSTCILAGLLAVGAGAAHAGTTTGDFDFLLGQWQIELQPKVSGLAAMIHGTPKLTGTLKAWRVFDGAGVEDELRIVDASGNPVALSRALLVKARDDGHWVVSTVDAYRATASEALGRKQDAELRLDGRGKGPDGRELLTRTRYFEIGADGFRMQQDRSYDNGQTWDEAVVAYTAKRTAAAAAE
ncbi:MAG TPA: hypothetical protein VFB32_07825 [Rudaea sp.]|nr:hypothetical protein [Rudaea sp.]